MLLWRHAPSLGGTRPPRRLMSGWLLSPPALKKLGDAPAVRVPGYLGPFVNLSRGLLCWCSRTRVTPSGSTASPLVCSFRARSPASSSERLRPLALVHLHLGWCGWWDCGSFPLRAAPRLRLFGASLYLLFPGCLCVWGTGVWGGEGRGPRDHPRLLPEGDTDGSTLAAP